MNNMNNNFGITEKDCVNLNDVLKVIEQYPDFSNIVIDFSIATPNLFVKTQVGDVITLETECGINIDGKANVLKKEYVAVTLQEDDNGRAFIDPILFDKENAMKQIYRKIYSYFFNINSEASDWAYLDKRIALKKINGKNVICTATEAFTGGTRFQITINNIDSLDNISLEVDPDYGDSYLSFEYKNISNKFKVSYVNEENSQVIANRYINVLIECNRPDLALDLIV